MRFVVALSFLFVVSTTCVVSADAPTTAPVSQVRSTEAKESFRRGEAAYGAGNYEVAIREWNQAFAADPRPRIQFNLSQAYERLGRLPDAEAALVKFIESGDPDDPTYSDANARLVALRQRLSLTGVMVKGASEGGLILVDDQDWGRTPRPDKIAVAPGSHTLIVRWSGQPDFRTDVFVPAGQVVEITVPANGSQAAPPVAIAAGPATGPVSPHAAPTSSSKRPLLFGIGGGLAGAGIGMIVYGAVRGGATSSCGGDTYCNPPDEDAANRQSITGYVVGGTLLAASATMFIVGALTGRGGDDKQVARSKLPLCGVGLAAASCRIRF